jgi:hypothetical protein
MEAMPATLNLRVRNVVFLDSYADSLEVPRAYAARLLLDWLEAHAPSLQDLMSLR